MPNVPLVVPSEKSKVVIRVLATGFGKFRGYETKENPSWLAVSQLHNLVLEPDESSKPIFVSDKEVLNAQTGEGDGQHIDRLGRPIHITALKIPVTYDAVLSRVPGFHARPPVLALPPGSDDLLLSGPPPPDDGYDFILHVGVGMGGGLKIEQLGHKLGYYMADAEGKLAPPVSQGEEAPGDGDNEKILEDNGEGQTLRGFGKGYERFAEELKTDINARALVLHLHEYGYKYVLPSDNAGRYLCEFIYYCSLAEQRRTQQVQDGAGKKTKVLFVHCPPVNAPLSTEEVVDGLKRVISWVIGEESRKGQTSNSA